MYTFTLKKNKIFFIEMKSLNLDSYSVVTINDFILNEVLCIFIKISLRIFVKKKILTGQSLWPLGAWYKNNENVLPWNRNKKPSKQKLTQTRPKKKRETFIQKGSFYYFNLVAFLLWHLSYSLLAFSNYLLQPLGYCHSNTFSTCI